MTAHSVYRCYDSTGRLIYVGCARNWKRRVQNHRTVAWWGDQIADVRHEEFPDKDAALTAERRAIATENPRWNVKTRWTTRCAWSAQDYVDYYLAASSAHGRETPPRTRHLALVASEALRRCGVILGEVPA